MKKTLMAITALCFMAVAAAQVGMSVVATPTGGYNSTRISTATTTVVKSGYGTLHSVTVNSPGAATGIATLYNNTAGSGTALAVIDTTTKSSAIYDLSFSTGLTVVTGGTTTMADLTVTYK